MLKILLKIAPILKFIFSWFAKSCANKRPSSSSFNMTGNGNSMHIGGQGGNGGSPTVVGNNNVAVGGQGGAGGTGGKGGDGGSGVHHGDNLFVMGGEGGEAGQPERGGKGGRSSFEILGRPNIQLSNGTSLWDYGRGGDGAPPHR